MDRNNRQLEASWSRQEQTLEERISLTEKIGRSATEVLGCLSAERMIALAIAAYRR
jgi:hypothetical protein